MDFGCINTEQAQALGTATKCVTIDDVCAWAIQHPCSVPIAPSVRNAFRRAN